MSFRKPTGQKDGLNHAVSIQDRFQQMTAQERLIQQKKQEIENKKMLKDQEDAMKLIEEKSKTEKKQESTKPINLPTGSNMFQNDGSFIEKFKRLQEMKASPQEVNANTNQQFSSVQTTNQCTELQPHLQEPPLLQNFEGSQIVQDLMSPQQCIIGQQQAPSSNNFPFNPSLSQNANQYASIAHQFPVQQQIQQNFPPPVNLPIPISNNTMPLQFNMSQSSQAVPPPVILPPSVLPITTCSSAISGIMPTDEDEYDPMNPTDDLDQEEKDIENHNILSDSKPILKISLARAQKRTIETADEDTSQEITPEDKSIDESSASKRKRKKSRWATSEDNSSTSEVIQTSPPIIPPDIPTLAIPGPIGVVTPVLGGCATALVTQPTPIPGTINITPESAMNAQYARQVTGADHLTLEQKKQIQEQQKMNAVAEYFLAKRKAMEAQAKALEIGLKIKPKYEYDSDEDTDGGTWEHKRRMNEMQATAEWAEKLSMMGEGKHHIGDFLPPEELNKFMDTFQSLKDGKQPELSDYKEFKLKCDNIGYKMLQKMGWQDGEGLGSSSQGTVEPVNKGKQPAYGGGLGLTTDMPGGLSKDDDEFEAYRKRMMLAYRFRPNPLNNPRRPYY
ncbi:DgyrCDS5696 [Dimorphilus gyrociliatus]|uniref:DgyrCDS5696 n=1 Tax=Dimorphilus gyrociliatus TaxID=2664684 RepID=A0A7I8VND8_9ANNE|nr:DgyrCDS5696 [Dimorphilus gyrociliatus]